MITKLVPGLCVIAAMTLAGCVDVPPDPDLSRHFDKIEALQTGDDQLSCADLKAQADALQGDINALEKQVAQQQSQSSGDSLFGALFSAVGAVAQTPGQALVANVDSAVANSEAGDAAGAANGLQGIEMTYQRRHDHLVSLYSAKNCASSQVASQ
jgi:outer membrane murein-binding lipoprotein Lpp